MKKTVVQIGGVKIGGGFPVAVQSMTNTPTEDVKATVKQCCELAEAGAEIIRLTVNNDRAAASIPEIRHALNKKGLQNLPLVGDFHFNGHRLLTGHPETAKVLDKYRINPGNVGFGQSHDQNFAKIIEIAIKNNKPVRIGINSGSLDPELLRNLMDKNASQRYPRPDREVFISAMVESAILSAHYAEKLGLPQDKIVLSVKMTDVQEVIQANQLLAKKTEKHPYCIHLGLTEAGSGLQGTVSSTAALAILLQQGIGDTIRVSLTPDRNHPRTHEVQVARQILQSLGVRRFQPTILSCPGCGRADTQAFQTLTTEITTHVKRRTPIWIAQNPATANLKIAIMGCVVNGPGESRQADIAISLPGNAEPDLAEVYIKGKRKEVISNPNIPAKFIKILDQFIKDF